MKTKFQLVVSVAALGALLSAPAAQATDVARLPLKASVLAKPNVIFGMDDSGSMDWEVLLDTASGLFWWHKDDGGWSTSAGKPRRTSSYRPYAYLFPVGSATEGQLYNYSADWGGALPPTPQFAWLRSSKFNPLYYDPAVTYKPWSPAYLDGAKRSYADASPGAAPIHGAYPSGQKLALDTQWDNTNANFLKRDDEYTFLFQNGMFVPDDRTTTNGTCAKDAVQTAGQCWAGVPYYPATYWQPETCTVDNVSCAAAPDGTTLKRHEIKPANYATTAEYDAAMQNFANWFTYYRKRKLMLAGSMGKVIEDLTGLRLGVMEFTDASATTPTVPMYDTDASAAASNGLAVAGQFYKNAMSAEGTPTHATVKHIAKQFGSNTNIVQYACQRNSMFIVTDGFSNTTSISVPSYDSSKFGGTAPYTTTPTGSLADLALAYYTNRLRTDLAAGKVPPSASDAPNADKNTDLHINTYAISLGVRGSLWPNTVDPFETAPTWPTPVADDPSMIDDQWHATINGRGLMYLATNPTDTAEGIQKVFNDIISQTGAQGGVAVSTVNLARGDNRAYFGTYNPAGWAGDVTAHPIDPVSGSVDADTVSWSAAAVLDARDWTTRVIASYNGSAGVGFTAAGVGSDVNPSAQYGSDADVFAYLRGDRSKEGTQFRKRVSLIGAVINSEPAVQRTQNVVYVQSGEGMLHAIDTASATAGAELWAFVPRSVLASIGETSERGYVFSSLLDGSPTVGPIVGSKTLLVAGTGAAGRSFHAIDVTSPRGLSETDLAAKVKWEFPSVGDSTTQAKVGQALGRPRIVKTVDGKSAVLVTSGYNNNDGRGRLWMLELDTAGNISATHEFDTGVGSTTVDAGLAQVSAYLEDNGTVRYAYAGDLLGNVWRFDLKDKGTPVKLAVLKDAAGNLQPVTAAPELTEIEGKRVIVVGTGRLLHIGDFGSTRTQTMYAIADGATLSNARSSLVAQTYNQGTDTISSNPVDFASDRGWYVDLPAGQQANTQPTIANGALAFTTNTSGATDCSASSRLYVLDLLTGGKFNGADFVSVEISPTANSSGVTALSTTGQKIVGSGQDADGKPWEREIVKTQAITPAKNAWREIRRQ